MSCASMDIQELRKRHNSILPVCLVVTTLPWTFQRKDIAEIADGFNKDIGFEAIKVASIHKCVFPDDLVILSFVKNLPEDCGQRGCVKSKYANNLIFWRHVYIHENAPWTTIRHEMAHLVGCNHGDWKSPCNM